MAKDKGINENVTTEPVAAVASPVQDLLPEIQLQTLEQLRAAQKVKGTRDITDLANAACQHDPLLKAMADAVGGKLFAIVWKKTHGEKYLDLVGVVDTSEILKAVVPEHVKAAIYKMRDAMNSGDYHAIKMIILGGKIPNQKELYKGRLYGAFKAMGIEPDKIPEIESRQGETFTRFEFADHFASEEQQKKIADRKARDQAEKQSNSTTTRSAGREFFSRSRGR